MKRYDPYTDPDAVPCPGACGRLTDDPYGGPCTSCWNDILADDEDEDAGLYPTTDTP